MTVMPALYKVFIHLSVLCLPPGWSYSANRLRGTLARSQYGYIRGDAELAHLAVRIRRPEDGLYHVGPVERFLEQAVCKFASVSRQLSRRFNGFMATMLARCRVCIDWIVFCPCPGCFHSAAGSRWTLTRSQHCCESVIVEVVNPALPVCSSKTDCGLVKTWSQG